MAEVIDPIQVMVFSTRLALVSKLSYSHDCLWCRDPREKEAYAQNKWLSYQKQNSKAYNKNVRPRTLFVGDLVLKAVGRVQKDLSALKFVLEWEGPYVIPESFDSGYFLISAWFKDLLVPINLNG